MILHLCHHWFWITTLKLLLTMTVIVNAHEEQVGNTNASHPTTVRARFKLNLPLNVTRLYPVPDVVVPENNSRVSEATKPTVSSRTTSEPEDFTGERVAEPSLTSDDVTSNKSERLEREIGKNVTQSLDIGLGLTYEPDSDGLEHDKLSHRTQDYVRKVSTSLKPPLPPDQSVSEQSEEEIKNETESYTIFVTPSRPSILNDLSTTATPEVVVKKSENISKIKDKVEFMKPKYPSKMKAIDKSSKTTTLKLIPDEVMPNLRDGVTPLLLVTLPPVPAMTSSEVTLHANQDATEEHLDAVKSSTSAPVHTSANASNMSDYEIMNDSPDASKDNLTESTSAVPDYEELNSTSPSGNVSSDHNSSDLLRASSHGRMLNVSPPRKPQAHAEDLSHPWTSGGTFNVAVISGISFGAVVLITLIVTASFIMYRRYRWNKPQTLSDKCSNPDSSGYIDDSTLRENSEEMYSLDNDSFLNSLEAMTIQNYWTDHVKHTKL